MDSPIDQPVLLLMVQKSGESPVDMVVYPTIYKVLYIPGGWEWDFWTINSVECNKCFDHCSIWSHVDSAEVQTHIIWLILVPCCQGMVIHRTRRFLIPGSWNNTVLCCFLLMLVYILHIQSECWSLILGGSDFDKLYLIKDGPCSWPVSTTRHIFSQELRIGLRPYYRKFQQQSQK